MGQFRRAAHGAAQQGQLFSRRPCFSPAFFGGSFRIHQPPLYQTGQLPLKGTHFILAQKTQGHLPGAFARQGAHLEILQGNIRATGGIQASEFPIQKHGLFVAFQFFAHSGRHFAHMVAQVFQRRKITEQFLRRLFSYAAHAGHIVAGIADQGLDIRPLGRLKPGLLAEGVKRHQLFLA